MVLLLLTSGDSHVLLFSFCFIFLLSLSLSLARSQSMSAVIVYIVGYHLSSFANYLLIQVIIRYFLIRALNNFNHLKSLYPNDQNVYAHALLNLVKLNVEQFSQL